MPSAGTCRSFRTATSKRWRILLTASRQYLTEAATVMNCSYSVKSTAAPESGGEPGGATARLVAKGPLALATFETQGLIEGCVPLTATRKTIGPQARLRKPGEIASEF